MITVQEVMLVTGRLRQALAYAGSPPSATQRVAFLVTMEEMSALVTELENNPDYGVQLEPEHAQHIREGRAMLHLNETPILPELIEAGPPGGKTDA